MNVSLEVVELVKFFLFRVNIFFVIQVQVA